MVPTTKILQTPNHIACAMDTFATIPKTIMTFVEVTVMAFSEAKPWTVSLTINKRIWSTKPFLARL